MKNLNEIIADIQTGGNEDEAKSAIKELFKSTVPEENKSFGYGSNPEGWNICRKVTLEAMDLI